MESGPLPRKSAFERATILSIASSQLASRRPLLTLSTARPLTPTMRPSLTAMSRASPLECRREALLTQRSTSSSETPSSRYQSTLAGHSPSLGKGVRAPQGYAMRSVTTVLLDLIRPDNSCARERKVVNVHTPRKRGNRAGEPRWSIMGFRDPREEYNGARGALYNLLQRYALPGDGPGHRGGPGRARGTGGLSPHPDVLRPDALQHRLPARGHPARETLRRGLRPLRCRRRAFRLLREHGTRAVSHGRRPGRRPASRGECRGARPPGLRALRIPGPTARRHRRRGLLSAPGHVPSDVPLLADAQGR